MWFILALLFTFPRLVIAQQDSDYHYQYDQYTQKYQVYVDKKQADLQYRTLASQNERLTATLDVVIARNMVVKTYLTSLQNYLISNQSSDPDHTQKLITSLQSWGRITDEQLNIIAVLKNQTDLTRWSTDFSLQYPKLLNLVYASLIQSEVNLRLKTLTKINNLLPVLNKKQNINLDAINAKIDTTKTYLDSSISLYQKNLNSDKYNGFYDEAKNNLDLATKLLIEINSDLKLIYHNSK